MADLEYETEITIRVFVTDAHTCQYKETIDIDAYRAIKMALGKDAWVTLQDYIEETYHNQDH